MTDSLVPMLLVAVTETSYSVSLVKLRLPTSIETMLLDTVDLSSIVTLLTDNLLLEV